MSFNSLHISLLTIGKIKRCVMLGHFLLFSAFLQTDQFEQINKIIIKLISN